MRRSRGMACKQQTSVLVVSSNNVHFPISTLSETRHDEKCKALKKFLLCKSKRKGQRQGGGEKVKILALNILYILHALRARMRKQIT